MKWEYPVCSLLGTLTRVSQSKSSFFMTFEQWMKMKFEQLIKMTFEQWRKMTFEQWIKMTFEQWMKVTFEQWLKMTYDQKIKTTFSNGLLHSLLPTTMCLYCIKRKVATENRSKEIKITAIHLFGVLSQILVLDISKSY